MKTNTELLMNALGWQGGTVHQVSQTTRLSVSDILNLHKYYPGDGDIRAISYHFSGKRRCEKYLSVDGYDWEGYDNLMYWRGVLDAMREREEAEERLNTGIDPGFFLGRASRCREDDKIILTARRKLGYTYQTEGKTPPHGVKAGLTYRARSPGRKEKGII